MSTRLFPSWKARGACWAAAAVHAAGRSGIAQPLPLGRRLCWRGMVVGVGLFAMLRVFLRHSVIVAVDQLSVVMRMGMPVGAVLPFAAQAVSMMVRNVVVIVGVRHRRMGVLCYLALTLCKL